MLEKVKPPLRLQHPFNFPEGRYRVGNRTEGEGADHAIEVFRCKGQLLGIGIDQGDGDRCASDTVGHSPGQQGHGVYGCDPRDGMGIVRDVQAGAESDFEDRARGLSKQFLPGAEEELLAQRPIHETREDDGGVHVRRQPNWCGASALII